MIYVDVFDRHYICGIEINGHTVGYRGDRSVVSEVVGWTGVRLVSDGLGCASFHFHDVSGWQDTNPMHRPHDSDLPARYCEINWDEEDSSGILLLSLDVRCVVMFPTWARLIRQTFKVNALAVVPSTVSNLSSMMWQTSLPTPGLKSMVLLNRYPDERSSPF
jgi:hypothetical protein